MHFFRSRGLSRPRPVTVHALEPRSLLAAADLLLDINQDTLPSNPAYFGAGAGGVVYFTAEVPATGRELYKTNGTPAGTTFVKDIRPGTGSAFDAPNPDPDAPQRRPQFTAVGNLTYFVATDRVDHKLWRTDGTAAGTVLVSQAVSSPNHLTAVGNTLYFVGYDTYGMQLWRTDGTAAGTRAVSDIDNPFGSYGADIDNLTVSGGKIYFAATDAAAGRALWVSDGTTAGTKRISDPAAGAAAPENLFDAGNGTLYFSGRDDATWIRTLWKTTGTAASTAPIADVKVNPDVAFARLGTFVYFGSAEPGWPLYRTDGTAAGTSPVSDVNNMSLVLPRELVAFGSYLYASAATVGNPGVGLYRTDGTRFSTSMIAPPLWQGEISGLTVANGKLFFTAPGYNEYGEERTDLYVTNGQPFNAPGGPHTKVVQQISDGLRVPADWRAVLGTKLIFAGTDRAGGAEPWASDGVAAPVRLKDINTDNDGPNFGDPAVLGNRMYFTANDGPTGRELWSTDGTPAGTKLVTDLNPGEASSDFYSLTPFNGRLYFANYGLLEPWGLWSTDGTAAGTRRDVNLETLGLSRPHQMSVYNGALYFLSTGSTPVNDRYRFQLWKSNGTAAGTAKVADIDTYSSQGSGRLTVAAGLLYFSIHGNPEAAVWRTDGTPQGTVRLVEFPSSEYEFDFVEAGGKVFFGGGRRGTERELWVTDGTIAGTQPVAPDVINPAGGTAPQYLTEYRGRLFFAGYDGTKMTLFETDGTPEGTRLADVPGYNGGGLFRYNDRLYFVSYNSQNRPALTKTDGTSAGTETVYAPATGSIPGTNFMFETNDMLAFQATSGATYHWFLTDGTTAGTSEVTGNYEAWREPAQLGNRMLFPAESPGKGIEWWRTTVADVARPQASWARLTTLANGGHAVRVVFTENVAASLATSDLVLADAATGNAISSAFSAVSFDAATNTATFTVSSARFTGGKLPVGRYRVSVAAGAVADAAGNTSAAVFRSEFAVTAPATVAARHVFYNGSALDGFSAGADARDDAAVAADKQALRGGGAATFGNVTGYSRGVNGIILDLAGLPQGAVLGGNDFSFRVSGGPGAAVPPPAAIRVRRGAGANGSARVTIVWSDPAVRNGWLEVTVKANERTGLASPDVFSFGNLVGDAGGTGAPKVDAADVLGTRLHLGRTDAASRNRYDFNRDGVINAVDVALVRSNLGALPAPLAQAAVTSTREPTASASAPDSLPAPAPRAPTRPPRRTVLGDPVPGLLE